MTRFDLIKLLEDCDDKLLCEVDLNLHDLAREQAHYAIQDAIERLQENECDDRG